MRKLGAKQSLSVIVLALLAGWSLEGPAHAAEPEPTDPPDVVQSDEFITVPPAELEQDLGEADTAQEDAAVDEYLGDLGPSDTPLTAEDLSVGTVDLPDDLSMVVVAPEVGADVTSLDVALYDEDEGMAAGAEMSDSDEPMTSGPGMGGFPSWDTATQWTVVLKLYKGDDWFGTGEFTTMKRWFDGDGAGDRWQVARHAYGKPGEISFNGPNGTGTVKTLWMSDNLTDATQPYAKQWLHNYTNPEAQSDVCGSNGIDAGPWSFGVSNCEEYDPWLGDAPNDVGHYRLSFDQGSLSFDGSRESAYQAGFLMAEGVTPRFTWYEFITIRVGMWGESHSTDPWYKCTSNELGAANDSQILTCTW